MKGFLVLAVLGAAGAAQAQVPNPFNLTYRIGFHYPLSERGRDIGKSWFAAGVDYPLAGLGVPTTDLNASGFISLDYYEKGGNRSIPLMANYSVRYGDLSYVSGIGFGFNRIAGDDEKIELQYQLGLGYRLGGTGLPLSIEARWWQARDSRLSGIGVYLGLRF